MQVHSDPVPHVQPKVHQSFCWPIGTKIQLLPRTRRLELDFVQLLEQRQTRRVFSEPLENDTLGEFLWLACRNRSSRSSPFGIDQESRVHPSGGAMHPVHTLVCRNSGPWTRYDPIQHALFELSESTNSAKSSREAACKILEVDRGILIGLVAEPGRTAAKYENPATIVWRDAGVVLGYMSLVAEALGLAFCPLGISGQPYLTDYLTKGDELEAVGLAVLGAD